MQRISAACAMEWSIELDKGLRSRKPGAAVEAVRKIGPRLEQWGREPKYTMAAYSMFGLVPGEDKLFASAILLRLAEAFRVGDKGVRRAVVQLFLSDLKRRRRRKRREGSSGIFSKCSEENCLEMMWRVKVVFDQEDDVELRADCLVLFGCWASFAVENADIRYLILMSLASANDAEVKASLFAAGCFCELSDDFSSVILHFLVNLATSAKTSSDVRLAGIRTFGRMYNSFVITRSAYKAASLLLQNSSDEDVVVVLLITLSKLASKSTLLAAEQANLLCSVLNKETTLRTKATALISLNFISKRGCYFRPNAQLLESLFSLVEHPQVPDNLQYVALEILQKILLRKPPIMGSMVKFDCLKLLETLQNVSQSQSSINRVLAFKMMASTASKLKEDIEVESSKVTLASHIISLITDYMTILGCKRVDYSPRSNAERDKEGLSLFKVLFLLAKKNPDHCMLVVDKICLLIERLDRESGTTKGTSLPGLLAHVYTKPDVDKIKTVRSKLLQGTCRVLSACLEVLFEIGAINMETIYKVKSTIRLACDVSYRSCSSFLDFVLLHPHISWTILPYKPNFLPDKNAIWDELAEFEILALDSAKNMLAAQAYWPAYRYGVRAACQGSYIVLILICEHLMTKVRSGIYFCWLKFLVEFTYSEWEMQQIYLSKPSIALENWLKANKVVIMHPWQNMGQVTKDVSLKTDLSGYSRKLLQVHSNLCSARKTLDSSVINYEGFYFQRWFLALKAKFIEAVLELLKIVSSHASTQESDGHEEQVERGSLVNCTRISGKYVSWSTLLSRTSSWLKRLALEFDLMLTSFADLDMKSLNIISALALSSSVLAFSAQLLFPIPKGFPLVNDWSAKTEKFSGLVHNLVYRLSHVDEEMTKNIGLLLKVVCVPKGCFHLPSRTQMLASFGKNEILRVCNHAITGFTSLQNEINSVSQTVNPSKIAKIRIELLSDTILRCLAIPFPVPKSFFHCRPLMGSELFVINADPKRPDCLSTSVGCCLALNLCIQLKNFPSKLSHRIKNLYCILQSRSSFLVPKSNEHVRGRTQSSLPAWEADYLIDLNQKLLHHVTECKASESSCQEIADKGSVYAFVRLEPNENYQGFSTSLLDVSGFPPGSYETRWLSCCVDDQGWYWSMLPLNAGPTITIHSV
uniref:Integrator complex subunit 7 n=1 Tax=Kalanchoe fedtschenkoi TaxID=63787 RepID=A0A7N0V250_KALFE